MTVILVLLTFIFFLLIDHFVSRKKVVVIAEAKAAKPLPPIERLANGFRLPENFSYHLGHTWALSESPTLIRVGVDEFASKLLGKIDSIALPQRGTWVRQGAKLATVTRDGKTVNILSPVEGSITDINEEVVRDPKTLKDNYGSGWLVAVNAPDKRTNFRNLISGDLARVWTESCVGLLHSPVLAQDGGEAIDDFAVVNGKDWETTAKSALLN